jgi:hypothetical protein
LNKILLNKRWINSRSKIHLPLCTRHFLLIIPRLLANTSTCISATIKTPVSRLLQFKTNVILHQPRCHFLNPRSPRYRSPVTGIHPSLYKTPLHSLIHVNKASSEPGMQIGD